MKNQTVSFLALVAAAVCTQSLFAGVIPAHDLQITENSSTALSATFDGSPVTVQNTASDRWTLTFPETFTFGAFVLDVWAEPENNVMANTVVGDETNQLLILSDVVSGHNTVPDGTTFVENLVISGSQTTLGITFHDNGDGARVPDSGSTSGLLFLTLIALGAVSRRWSRVV